MQSIVLYKMGQEDKKGNRMILHIYFGDTGNEIANVIGKILYNSKERKKIGKYNRLLAFSEFA